MSKLGEFVWHDLATPDLQAAAAFYGEVVGWDTMEIPSGSHPYLGFQVGEEVVGAAMELADELQKMGVPSSWTPCMAVEDIEGFCDRVEALGGTVVTRPTQVPGGRFALFHDPQGATFEVYQSDDKNGESVQVDRPPDGHFCWYDLNTDDLPAARAFYCELFGWSESAVMESPEGPYWMFRNTSGARTVGGMFGQVESMGAPPHWLCYVTVPDLDAALARLQELGGKVLNGPMEVPGGDRIAHCMDDQGAAIALHSAPPGRAPHGT